ncbi:MAG TPA: penicillin acylase family protein [Bacteroidota bacterium]|jgi:penicillin amidase|nr:penicillin acylase family protein [Bacteroidota bacterium]
MSKISKILIGSICTAVVLSIVLFVLLRSLVTKSFPVTNGTLVASGLQEPVDIYRDAFGIPHVSARNAHDLMFTEGYVHAQDRLWQMDLGRRAGQGRLSEVLGKPTLDYDLLFRTIGLPQHAQRIYEHLHPETQRLLTDYAEGVNAFISSHKGKYPIEFDMLNYEPEPWKPEHSILLGRLMAWELNLAWWTDLAYGEIAAKVSPEKLREIIPRYDDSDAVNFPSSALQKSISGLRPDMPGLHDLLNIARSYRTFFGLGSLEAGSNGWVVDSSKTFTGKPMLANDPHLAMPAPSRWYEIHLNAPGWNVAGVGIPGIPVIIIGHNEHLAWGLTNAMIDDADFYVERVDSANPSRYAVQKTFRQFEEREEKILVKDADSVVIVARSTIHGPVINDVHPTAKHGRDSSLAANPIAMRWTGLDVSDEIYGFSLMNRATTIQEFERGVKEIAVPGQCIVYADVNNNIGYWVAARIPIREKQAQPMLPLQGWTGDADWKGYIPFDDLPKIINPREGVIASANQKLADARFPYYLSTLWEPPSRIQRIRQLLHSTGKFTVDDFQQFQQDIYSPFARDLTHALLNADHDTSQNNISEALNYLRNWDFHFTRSDVATTIFNTFVVKLFHNIYEDEMGSDVFNDFVFFGAIPYRVTSQLLASDDSLWFDNITTPAVETNNDILRQSLSDAVTELTQQAGSETKNWQWGKQHTVTFKHPFGSRKPLDRIFNLGPFPISGGGTTVMKTEYRFTTPYAVAVGPSMRHIVDLSQPLDGLMVITSGESGQPLNKHYDDQTSLWLNGGYRSVTIDWSRINNESWDHLILQPR